jgi:hypothetical protein
MSIDLSNYSSIESGLFVRIECSYYKTSSGATPTTQVLTFSDYVRPVTIGSDSYLGLGRLLGITSSSSELRVTSNDISISISGIPNSSISAIIHSRIKGSDVLIYRALFNSTTGAVLSISGNPLGRFKGVITNYSLSEDWDSENRSSTNTITFNCSSILDVLANTASGRRTNPEDQKGLYPTDLSMDRVPSLVGANFNFGAPV